LTLHGLEKRQQIGGVQAVLIHVALAAKVLRKLAFLQEKPTFLKVPDYGHWQGCCALVAQLDLQDLITEEIKH
jgi:hypothetical protein